MITNQHSDKKNGGGRPRKFGEPSRAVTLTLPDSVLSDLQAIDPDRSRAIVKLTRMSSQCPGGKNPPVEIVEMKTNIGLVVVCASRTLQKIPFLHLVEVAPGRYILALDPGNDFRTLEIALNDALDDSQSDSEERERNLIEQLLEHIRHLRKSERVSMAEVLLINLKKTDSKNGQDRTTGNG